MSEKCFQSTQWVLKYQTKSLSQEVIYIVQLNKSSICIISLVKICSYNAEFSDTYEQTGRQDMMQLTGIKCEIYSISIPCPWL